MMSERRNIGRQRVVAAKDQWIAGLLQQNALVRSTLIWIATMIVLQSVFYLAVWVHPEAWQEVATTELERGWPLLALALLHNSLIMVAIGGGNLFVRFGSITPGLIVLVIQAVTIGWVAGTNSFAAPFPSVAAANAAFLRVGLWETSAYAIMCAVTLPKSLLISATFPAREWMDRRTLNEVGFTLLEGALIALSVLMLVGAAIMEAFG
jgi:hypothetical protein